MPVVTAGLASWLPLSLLIAPLQRGHVDLRIQRADVRDVRQHPIPPAIRSLGGGMLPARRQLLFSVENGMVACSLNGKEDADRVAFRLVADRDQHSARFTDLRLAWRVNRQQLPREPIDSCQRRSRKEPPTQGGSRSRVDGQMFITR